jgi:hypothetical protein
VATRIWTNGNGLALSAANLNSLEADLAAKADNAAMTTALAGKSDTGHTHVKADVGLGNVDNTSDANKPVSAATSTALAGKSDTGHTHTAATSTAAGFMSASDKAKLDAASAGAANGNLVMRDASGNTAFDRVLLTDAPVSADMATRKDYVDNINSGNYKGYVQADSQSVYPIGVTQFLGETAGVGLWQPWGAATSGAGGFCSITTIKDKTYAGSTLQIAAAYGSDTYPLAYRAWRNGATSWGAWSSLSNQSYVDSRTPLSVTDFGAVGDGVFINNTTIQNAINAAITAKRGLYWPDGTYLKTANILNFHTVKHYGPGVVKQGTDLFYVEPNALQPNTLYVATSTASDTYDGISRSNALRTTNKAIDILPNYGAVLNGFWAIQLDAGTYSDRATCPVGLDATGPITIRGPIVNHPNVPTAVYTEGYNIGAVAFDFTDAKAEFVVSNIKFSGYNGTSSSAGIKSSSNEGNFYLINCHFVDNFWGATNQSGAMDVKGGIFQRNGFLGDTANNVAMASRNGNGGGYRGLMGSKHSIGTQDSGDLLKGPFFYGNRSGIFAQETCTGHVDWCVFEDNDFGVNINVNSRANVDGSSFKRNNIALRAIGNSHIYVTTNNVFGTGVDENPIPISLAQGSQMTDDNRLFTNVAQSYNTVMRVADTVFPNLTVTAQTATVIYTATLGGLLWRDAINSVHERKRINVKIYGELIGTLGTKAITIRLGSSTVSATFTSAEVGIFEAEATVFFTDSAKQFVTLRAIRHLGTNVRTASAQMTNAMTSNTNLTVESTIGTAGDSVRIDAIDMSWG